MKHTNKRTEEAKSNDPIEKSEAMDQTQSGGGLKTIMCNGTALLLVRTTATMMVGCWPGNGSLRGRFDSLDIIIFINNNDCTLAERMKALGQSNRLNTKPRRHDCTIGQCGIVL